MLDSRAQYHVPDANGGKKWTEVFVMPYEMRPRSSEDQVIDRMPGLFFWRIFHN